MFIEGIIDKAYYALLVDACYDIVWVCESEEDAVQHGYDAESYTMAEEVGECIARIFIDCNVEDYTSYTGSRRSRAAASSHGRV